MLLALVMVLALVPFGVIGWDILYKSVRNIAHGQIFDENFLMCIATFGAFAIAEYPEAVFVMIFYQIGELFQSIAVGKSRKSISELMNISFFPGCVIIYAMNSLAPANFCSYSPGMRSRKDFFPCTTSSCEIGST